MAYGGAQVPLAPQAVRARRARVALGLRARARALLRTLPSRVEHVRAAGARPAPHLPPGLARHPAQLLGALPAPHFDRCHH